MSSKHRASRHSSLRESGSDTTRQKVYFIPRDGIDRDVITANICHYLGKDALVRPGTYQDPITCQVTQGYHITARRNLTEEMMKSLKEDSARLDAERRARTGGSSSKYSGANEVSYSGSAPHAYGGISGINRNDQYVYRQPQNDRQYSKDSGYGSSKQSRENRTFGLEAQRSTHSQILPDHARPSRQPIGDSSQVRHCSQMNMVVSHHPHRLYVWF